MALGFQIGGGGGGGDIVPFVKYDARAGRFFRSDRAQDSSGNWASEQVEIQLKAVMDLENMQVGWLHFAAGQAPEAQMVPIGAPLPASPGEGWKKGVRILMKLAQSCGGDVREIQSNAAAFLTGVDQLHDEYLAGRTANPGKLPVVGTKPATAITSGSGAKKSTNYQPVFEIVQWVARPADLPVPAAPAAKPAAASPPSTGSTPVGAPVKQQAAAMAEDDFG
jgi:hypothetical protein